MTYAVNDTAPTARRGKVLFCIPTLEGGGAERQAAYLARGLADQGWAVLIATLRTGINEDFVSGTSVRVVELPHTGNYDPRILTSLRHLMGRERPDLLHTWLEMMDILGGLLSLNSSCLWVVSEQSDGGSATSPRNLLRKGLIHVRADALVANSQEGLDSVQRLRRRPETRFLVHNGVPCREIASTPPADLEELGLDPGTRLLLAAGRFTKQKNLGTLFPTIETVLDARPGTSAVVFGEGEERSRFQRWIADRKLGDRVRLPGYTSGLWGWMRRADVFLQLSLVEGQPNTVMEAMAAGAPLVVSDIPAHRSFLDDRTALLVDVRSVEQASTAAIDSLTNQEAATKRSERAYGVVRDFSVERMVAEHDRIYLRLLEWHR